MNPEEMISQYMKITQGHLEGLAKSHEEAHKLNEVTIKNLGMKMGHISTQIPNVSQTRLLGTTLDNSRYEA